MRIDATTMFTHDNVVITVPYFSGYKTEFLIFQNNPKNLDPSYDGSRSLGMFRKVKTPILAKFHRTDSVICCNSREATPVL